MERIVKRELRSKRSEAPAREPEAEAEEEDEETRRPRVVKRDPGGTSRNRGGERGETSGGQDVVQRRVLRSRYLAVKNLINDERESISGAVSDKFNSIIGEVESLHDQVQRPREQVADAEALLDIANTIVASVKSQSNEGVTPSDFITSLLHEFSPQNGESSSNANASSSTLLGKVGLLVSGMSSKVPGCSTMLGPMNVELKPRKVVQQRKRTRQAESSRPEELDERNGEERSDTDKNMATMFNILRRKKTSRLEHLILNRTSFAQTVENLFALSFLVKDGRVEIAVNNNGHHLISPRNAPAATAVASGEVLYNHFVFRFDFKDWKLMMDCVPNGEELMPHRTETDGSREKEAVRPDPSQTGAPTTPIRKLCRNRGLVIQEEALVEEEEQVKDKADSIRKGKRKIY